MAESEPARDALYSRLESVLGPEHAETLMTYLPPERSDQEATRSDISRLEAATESQISRLEDHISRLEDRFGRFEDRFDRRLETLEEVVRQQQRFYVGAMVGSMTALTAIFSVVVGILG